MTQPPPLSGQQAVNKSRKPIRFGCITLVGFVGLGIASVIVVLVLIVGGYIFNVSHKASHQSSPTGAANAYLGATLDARKPDLATSYTCGKKSIVKTTTDLINNIKQSEKDLSATISYTWTAPEKITANSENATVTAEITASTAINGSTSASPINIWTFSMTNDSGWKVCGLKMVIG